MRVVTRVRGCRAERTIHRRRRRVEVWQLKLANVKGD